jgi:hypothetical protein
MARSVSEVDPSLLSVGAVAASVLLNYLVIPGHGAIGSAWVTSNILTCGSITHGVMALWVNARWKAQLAKATPGPGSARLDAHVRTPMRVSGVSEVALIV